MHPEQSTQLKLTKTTIFLGILGVLFTVNILFLTLLQSTSQSIKLLKKELITVQQEAKGLASANDVFNQYESEMDRIGNVFPNEETIPDFIQMLETTVKPFADESTIKFSSLAPQTELDRLFLLMTISLRTDYVRLLSLFTALEKMSYMTHIVSVNAKTPQGIGNTTEAVLVLKVYVQNPFSAK